MPRNLHWVWALVFVLLSGLDARILGDEPVTKRSELWRGPFGLDRPAHLARTNPDRVFAEAEAHAESPSNPVDLGAILVPSGWLLLGPKGSAVVEVAVAGPRAQLKGAQIRASFASSAEQVAITPLDEADLQQGSLRANLVVPRPQHKDERDILRVELQSRDKQVLWSREIPTMLVGRAPDWPVFGAVETKLRYDAPISVREADGSFSEMAYGTAWDEHLHDVVVCFPNGARFVFWRGTSYVPFWAGAHNLGLSYEWAETSPPPDGFTDCVEPLMDKELRFGRVEIVESTASRVHVRWRYQSCDFKYKVWGDSAVEDFYFYPDGFGTRVLTLVSDLKSDYELSEFIILTPQGTYPLSALPGELVDILFLDGEKRTLEVPYFKEQQGEKLKSKDSPAMFRVRLHKHDAASAIYFHATETRLPPVVFAPFFENGEVVTPCYWGSHWPLARGQTTGGAIDDRVHHSPCHNSVMTWARQRPTPLRSGTLTTIDTLGRARVMQEQTWVWLVGMSDADDETLLDWARSTAHPPSIDSLSGAQLSAIAYAPERRSINLEVQSGEVSIGVVPHPVCVDPVFELNGAPRELSQITLDGVPLPKEAWTWDGETLFVGKTIREPAKLELRFAPESENR